MPQLLVGLAMHCMGCQAHRSPAQPGRQSDEIVSCITAYERLELGAADRVARPISPVATSTGPRTLGGRWAHTAYSMHLWTARLL